MRGNRSSHVKSSQSRVLCFGAWKMSSSARLLARGLSVTVTEGHPISPYFFETSCGIDGHFRRAQNSGKMIFRHIIRPWSLSIEPLKTRATSLNRKTSAIRIWVGLHLFRCYRSRSKKLWLRQRHTRPLVWVVDIWWSQTGTKRTTPDVALLKKKAKVYILVLRNGKAIWSQTKWMRYFNFTTHLMGISRALTFPRSLARNEHRMIWLLLEWRCFLTTIDVVVLGESFRNHVTFLGWWIRIIHQDVIRHAAIPRKSRTGSLKRWDVHCNIHLWLVTWT